MTVKIAHAVANENGKPTGGQPGDQTGREVRTQAWYDGRWTSVFRAKNDTLARMIASNAEKITANECYGYGQDNRLTAYREAAKVNFKLDQVKVNCELDCSSMVALCLIAAGVDVPPTMYTGNEYDKIMNTGMFDVYTRPEYLNHEELLRRGDILMRVGHTAVVISDGSGSGDGKTYFPRYSGPSSSIVDILSNHGEKSSFSYRSKIAAANGIKGYIGRASQNLKMVELVKDGKLIKPAE